MLVDWEDSARPIGAWQWVEDYELPETVRCISVGHLIAETDDALALAPNLGDVDASAFRSAELSAFRDLPCGGS